MPIASDLTGNHLDDTIHELQDLKMIPPFSATSRASTQSGTTTPSLTEPAKEKKTFALIDPDLLYENEFEPTSRWDEHIEMLISDQTRRIDKKLIIEGAIEAGHISELNQMFEEIESRGYCADLSRIDFSDLNTDGIDFRNSNLDGAYIIASDNEIAREVSTHFETSPAQSMLIASYLERGDMTRG